MTVQRARQILKDYSSTDEEIEKLIGNLIILADSVLDAYEKFLDFKN